MNGFDRKSSVARSILSISMSVGACLQGFARTNGAIGFPKTTSRDEALKADF